MAIKNVEAKTLSRWLDDGGATLVDVREPSEHKARFIPGAHSLPLGNVTGAALPDHKGRKLVVHCQSGRRSKAAAEKLLKENPELEIHNLEGGLKAWEKTGHKTESSPTPYQKERLAAGIGTVVGGLPCHNAAFFPLSAFFAMSQMYAQFMSQTAKTLLGIGSRDKTG